MKILIAEDEEDIALAYEKALETRKHEVTITFNAEDCLKTYHDRVYYMKFQTLPLPSRYSTNTSPFDTLLLDYKLPDMNGMEVAKEILAVNPHQRIIFVSAYVKETLQDSVKQLHQIVELMQKPITINELIDTIEDKDVYNELKKLNVDIDVIKATNPTHEQIMDLLKRLRKIEKMRTF
jgi:DNA-binding response OmpR family regulator